MPSSSTNSTTTSSRSTAQFHGSNIPGSLTNQDPDRIQVAHKRQGTHASANATNLQIPSGIDGNTNSLQNTSGRNHQPASAFTPHSLQETRISIILSKTTGLKQSSPRIPDFEESIVDTVLRRFGRVKPQDFSSDSFEEFMREKAEITLADVYHQICDKPAIVWQNIFSCRSLNLSYFDKSSPDFFQLVDYTGSVSDFFARTAQCLQDLKTRPDAVALCSIVMNEPGCRKVFSLVNLFAASAYPSPMFFALTICAYLLHWSDYLDDTHKIVESSLVSTDEPIVLDEFDLPSKSAPITNLLGSGLYEYTFIWAYKPPSFDIFEYTTKIPYKHEPVFEKIQISAQGDSNGSWHVTLLFRNQRIFGDFESTLKSVYEKLRISIQDVNSICNMRILHVCVILFAIYEQVNTELSTFLREANAQARNMTVEAREHPGRSKLLHMFVLVDYTSMSRYYLKASQDRLSTLDLTGYPSAFQELKVSIQDDITFLLDRLQKTSQRLKESQLQIQTFSEIKSAQTAGIMAVLVAVYVPLAGVAGYLGMNTVGIANGEIDTNVFWQTAIPLTFGTILIPLSATVIARLTVAASFWTRIFTLRNWPMVLDVLIVSTIIAIIIAHVVNWRTRTDLYFVRFFDPIAPYEAIITNSVLGMTQIFKIIEHAFLRNKRAKKWLLLFASSALVCMVCAGVSVVDSRGIATLVTPIIWVICVSAFMQPALSALGIM